MRDAFVVLVAFAGGFFDLESFFLLSALFPDCFVWVASFLANTVNSSLHHRTKRFQEKVHKI